MRVRVNDHPAETQNTAVYESKQYDLSFPCTVHKS